MRDDFNVPILGVILMVVSLVAWAVFIVNQKTNSPQRLKIKSSDVIQAKLMILDGDTVVDEVNLKDKFIFILKADGVYYGDTSTPGIFRAEYSNLNALGKGHRKIIKDAVE